MKVATCSAYWTVKGFGRSWELKKSFKTLAQFAAIYCVFNTIERTKQHQQKGTYLIRLWVTANYSGACWMGFFFFFFTTSCDIENGLSKKQVLFRTVLV